VSATKVIAEVEKLPPTQEEKGLQFMMKRRLAQ
jgi:hypothetical protein